MARKTPEEKAAAKQAVKDLRAADAALHALGKREKAAGIDYETPEFLKLNRAANEAAAKVSWFRR
ncbi:hypothetical protein [Streptomyces violaceusniger]|uniref:hypothetical protein n=1 Tax=Streptomyces violaceusniger TaxID=68280 RepID=UPI0036C7353C